jgi:hypothetical protein
VKAVVISPDGLKIVSGSHDKTIKIWDFNGTLLQTLDSVGGFVQSVAISHDGLKIVSGSDNNTIMLFDFTGKTLKILTGHRHCVWSVAISRDGLYIFSGSEDKTLNVWTNCRDYSVLQWAADSIRSDKDFMLAAVRQDSSALQWADEMLREDKEVVSEAVKQDSHCIVFASPRFLDDANMLELNYYTLKYTTAEFQCRNKEFLLSAISFNPKLLAFVTDTMRQDREVVMCASLRDAAVAQPFSQYELKDTDKKWLACLSDLNDKRFLSFAEKREYFKSKISAFSDESRFEIKVSRESLLESIILQITSATNSSLYNRFRVRFNNEEGKKINSNLCIPCK